MDLRPAGGHAAGPKLVLVHGAPTLNTLYWTEDRPEEFCLKMAGVAGMSAGDVIAFGHTHRQWHRELGNIHFVNTGSVGRPKDGDWRAGYVLLAMAGGTVSVEVRRVPYEIERTMSAIRTSDLPDEFAEYLRNGGERRVISRSPAT